MRLDRLLISDYRNLERVDLSPGPSASVFVGENAQGKSNLLEAVYMLATMRAARAETDAQVVRRGAVENDVLPAARVVGEVSTAEGPLKVEVAVVARPGTDGHAVTKTVKVNGVARRLASAVGRFTAVLFTAEDLEMVVGPPSLRRRYLDMTLAQVDPAYSSARARFERVLTQRNSLLKRIREGLAGVGELSFWDEELAKDGAVIFHRRLEAASVLSALASDFHSRLAPGEELSISYRPRIDLPEVDMDETAIRDRYQRVLAAHVSRDVAAGITLSGPHRDDVEFALDGLAAAGFASRAQQRTIALSLRLGEARFLHERRGEPPVLLLDDILSEMDAGRRASVLGAIGESGQMLVTGTDWDRFPADFLEGASLYSVAGGSVHPAGAPALGPRTGDS